MGILSKAASHSRLVTLLSLTPPHPQSRLKEGCTRARQYNIYVIIVSLLEILENFSLVSVDLFSQYEKYYCLEILDHIGVTQACDSKRVNHLKRTETQTNV